MIYDLVVIGAGPCGIAATVEGKLAGLNVLLLEKGGEHSQTIQKFYKEGKRVDKAYKGATGETIGNVEFYDGTKESTLEYFTTLLNHTQNITYNCEVESVTKSDEGIVVHSSNGDFVCKNALIAIGKMGKQNRPSYKIPLTLNAVVNFNANSCKGGEKILVVGGGNSAAEYAVDLSEGNQTTLCYRKSSFSRLNEINQSNIEEANKAGKLALKLGLDIQAVQDAAGKPEVVFADGSSEVYDRVIYAIGGSTPVDFLKRCGVEVSSEGVAVVDENLQSQTKGLYVGGDIISKSGSIVMALNDAHKVVAAIINKN